MWWAVAFVTTALSAIQKLPCLRGRVDTDVLATAQCYSDVPLFYVGRGLAGEFGWLGRLNEGFSDLEYPPLINLFIEASAKLTHLVLGIPREELNERSMLTPAQLYDLPGMAGEERAFFLITCALLLVLVLFTVWIAWWAGWRLGDRVTWAVVVPIIVLTMTVNWDVVAIPLAAMCIVAWQRQRMAWFGVCVALGTAAKLFPLVMLAAGMVLALRRRSVRAAVAMTGCFVLTTVAVNAPLLLSNREAWGMFWQANADRPASFGSAWMAMRMVGVPVGADQLSLVLGGGMVLALLVLSALTRRRIIEPTFVELSMIFLVTFFVLGKVYSPQYSLWVVLGLLLVTRNRWMVGAVAAAETWHYVATWLYIREITTPDTGVDKTYWSSIMVRLAVEGTVVVYLLVQARRRATGRLQTGDDAGRSDPVTVVS